MTICRLLWKLNLDIPSKRNMLETQKKSCHGFLCYLCPLLGFLVIHNWILRVFLLHLELFSVLLFFVGANETYLRWINFVAVFKSVLVSLKLSAVCFIETQVGCANIIYSCICDIFYSSFNRVVLKILLIVPREFFIYVKYLNFKTYGFFFLMTLEVWNWFHTAFLTFQV